MKMRSKYPNIKNIRTKKLKKTYGEEKITDHDRQISLECIITIANLHIGLTGNILK